MPAHKDLTGTDLHEPKGVELATSGQIYVADGTGSGAWGTPESAIPSGSVMLFVQTSAPTGWTKSTAHNDKALRVVSGTASSGGTSPFSTVFGLTATSSHTLTTAEIPAHTHGSVVIGASNTDNIADTGSGTTTISGLTTGSSGSAGGGGGHTHGIELRVQYVDVIIATKD